MRKTKTYCGQYYHDGTWWDLSLDAYDFEDAEKRFTRLGAQLDGELIFSTSAPLWVVELICWFRNLFIR